MATAREIFEKDSSTNLGMHTDHEVGNGSGEKAKVTVKVSLDFDAGVRYLSLFVDDLPWGSAVVAHYIKNPDLALKVGEGVETQMGFAGTREKVSSVDLRFSGRMFVYTPAVWPEALHDELQTLAKANNVALVLRDGAYLAQRITMEKPMAFISHDSRDKDSFVRELANNLQKMLCTVWYDEFSLIPGQSLRQSIENGIKQCRKCVLVLSPHFIGNGGWTKAEFDSVFMREMVEQKNVVIPIWHGVTKEQVYDYSPRMLDRVAIRSDLGPEEVARRVLIALNTNT